MAAVDYQNILAHFQQSVDSANSANASRYNQLTTELGGLQQSSDTAYADMLAKQTQLGGLEKTKIQRGLTQENANIDQSLISSGLSNTTMRPSAQREAATQAGFAEQDVDTNLANQRNAIQQQQINSNINLAGVKGDAIANMSNEGPDLGTYASLITAAAEGGAGSGGLSFDQQMLLQGKNPDGTPRQYKLVNGKWQVY